MQENQIIKSTKDKKTKHSILSPKLDVVFQILFVFFGSEEITKDLLSAILDEQINTIDLNQNIVLRRKNPKDKMGIVDVLAKINDNEYCNIEMQVSDDKDIIKRILYYWSKQYSKELQKGHPYIDLKRTINVLIANFKIDILKNLEFHTQWKIIEENHPKTILTNKFEIHILELEKVKEEYKKNKENKKAQWLLFLDDPETEEVKEIMEKNEDVKEAVIEVRKLSQDEQLQREAELREKAIMDEKAIYQAGLDNGKEEGEKLGRKKGRVETMKEVAKKLLKQNMNIENVAEITGLTIEEIEKLR